MRTVRRLRLRCFSFNIYSDVLSTLLLFALSNLGQAHHKHTACRLLVPLRLELIGPFADRPTIGEQYVYGGPGGIRTPVQDTFLFASYSNKLFALASVLFKTISFGFIHSTRFRSTTTLTGALTNNVTSCISTCCHNLTPYIIY